MSRALLYTAFLLSGAAGLVYEVVWSRYLALFLGHSAEAAVLVIAMFLGGLSAGAWLTSKVSEELRSPLRAYAYVELAIGVVGLLFHRAFLVSTGLSYDLLFPLLSGSLWTQAVKWTVAGLLVFLPAVLMGATFPLMAAAVVRQERSDGGRTGRVLAALYGLNSLGGAAAVLVTGFLLIPAFGLPGSSVSAAGLNGAAALLALMGSLGGGFDGAPAPAVRTSRPSGPYPGRVRLLLVVAGGTALASFAYEVAWMRMLSLAMGNATHAFELMLSAFILGLALGALAAGRWADRLSRPLVALGVIQCLMGAFAVATVPAWSASFAWVADLVTELPRDDGGYALFSLARYGLSLLVMVPATVLAGMTLPLITNALLMYGGREAVIGRIYAVNTAGSIVGVAIAGLVLLPWVGLRALLGLGAGLDLALGLLLLAGSRGLVKAPVWGLAAASTAVFVVALGVPAWNPAVLTSGVYRNGRGLTELPEVLYYADGRSATIGVHRGADSLYVLTTNGKADASLTARWLRAAREDVPPAPIIQQDESTQMLTALISGAYGRSAREGSRPLTAAVIGHGSGISGHFLLADTAFSRITTIEIEPRVLDASRVYYPANRRVFDDPRSRIVVGDAKSFFARAGERYDLILSEPSNPWVSGTASLFTTEFYERVVRHLAPEGIFGQWIQLYETNDTLIASVLAAVHQSFSDYRAYLVGATDLMVVAAADGTLQPPDWAFVESPALARELRHIPPLKPHHLEGLQVFSRLEMGPLLERWPTPNSDFRPVLDLGAERARFKRGTATGVLGMASDPFRIGPALGGWALPRPDVAEVPMRSLSVQRQRRNAALAADAIEALDSLAPDTLRGIAKLVYETVTRLRTPPSAGDDEGWQRWARDFTTLDAVFGAGTSGDPVGRYYEIVEEALASAQPPTWAPSLVTYQRGVQSWDWPTAAQAAHRLLGPPDGPGQEPFDRPWRPPPALSDYPLDRFLDGAYVAALRAGDSTLVRRVRDLLLPEVERGDDDLRLWLLEAHGRKLLPPASP